MRTTISIDERLLDEVRRIAAAQRQTVSQVVEECIRESLLRSRSESRTPFEPGTFHAGAYQAGVGLDDDAALLDLMDERP